MKVEVIGDSRGMFAEVDEEDLKCLCEHRDRKTGVCGRAQLFVSFPNQEPRECNPDENSFCQPRVRHEALG